MSKFKFSSATVAVMMALASTQVMAQLPEGTVTNASQSFVAGTGSSVVGSASVPVNNSYVYGDYSTIYGSLNLIVGAGNTDRKSTRLNSSHRSLSRMPSSA